MKRSHASVALLLTSLLLVAGCSASTGTATSTPTPTASVNCDDPNITVRQAEEHCYGETENSEPGAAEETPLHGDPYVPLGEAIEYTRIYSDSKGTTWSVKLSKVKCGLKSLPETDSNPKWQGEEDVPQYITAKAPRGSDFCVLYWDWKNVGKVPDTTVQSGDLMFGDEQFARSSEDEMRSWTFMQTNLNVDYSAQVNPRKTTKSADIYTVDEGTEPDAVWFPMETMVDEVYTLMATK
jgi:hypothetical protein